ncbi:NADP-dependent oxidoreductase domain-containing protein [Mycena floridula]|nr:NADP-dependent oxidoreductase domain-containing protein [Mycena floridula]
MRVVLLICSTEPRPTSLSFNTGQDGSSEEIISKWAEKHGIRDQLVISTKYSTRYKAGNSNVTIKSIFSGNNMKSMHMSVNASLKKLRTNYIDILYMHWYDHTSSVDAKEKRCKESGKNGRTFAGPDWERTDKEKQVCKVLKEIAIEISAKHINAIGAKVEQLHDNLEALEISLTPEHMKWIEAVTPIDLGFPHDLTSGIEANHSGGRYESPILFSVSTE